jgi:tRNA (guanosine-2'-O-)-methyltransferase
LGTRRRASDEDRPERDDLRVSEGREPSGEAWRLLAPCLSEERLERLREVLAARVGGIHLVLDDLYDPHNLSAILRTAEAFGLQYVTLTGAVPEGLNPRVSLGAHRWLTIRRERDRIACLREFKERGFAVAVAVLEEGAIDPREYSPAGPVALVLGNERLGLGREWIEGADVRLKIPLAGFARSLNVSVAAGILIAELLGKSTLAARGLPTEELERLADLWIRKSVPHAAKILARLRGAP